MPTPWSERWKYLGLNEGGDPVYVRSNEEVEESPYQELSKAQLRALAEARGLPKSGTKDELIARLEEPD